jgi:predicted transcriptional regulator
MWTENEPYGRYTVHVNVGRPSEAVIPSLDGEVLQVLAASSMAMTGRQIALLTGRKSHSGVLDVLNRLTEHGLVKRVELNRANLYSLNREHLAYPAVIALAGMQEALAGHIQQELATWAIAPIHVSLFGSTARGDGDTHSDIDLFVVRPAATPEEDPSWREQLDGLASKIERWTGNRAAVLEAAEAELARLAAERPPIVDELLSDALLLGGLDVSTLLREQ